jgi:hypothetical protein
MVRIGGKGMRLLTIKQIKEGWYRGDSMLTPIIMYIPPIIAIVCLCIFSYQNILSEYLFVRVTLTMLTSYIFFIPLAFYVGLCETYIDKGDK